MLPVDSGAKWKDVDEQKSTSFHKGAKGDQPKGYPNEQQLLQNHALERSTFYFVYVGFVRHTCKNGHGALVGPTPIKGTSVENFSI